MFAKKMMELGKPKKERSVFNAQETVQCLYEATTWMFAQVDDMHLEDKDIFIVLGPTRTGKGTLLTALQGVKMKFVKKKDILNTEVGKEAYQAYFMAPIEDASDMPVQNKIISHQYNSHTIRPKFASQSTIYPDAFSDLNGLYMVDFPGLFETRGPEIDIAIHLTLQRILIKAKSAKALVLIASSCLTSVNSHIIDLMKHQLNLMFQDPEKHITIAFTKARIVQDSIDQDEILDVAQGNNGEMRNFKGYKVMRVEQDDPILLQNIVQDVIERQDIKCRVKRGFFDPQLVEMVFREENPEQEVKNRQTLYWIECLQQRFEDNVGTLHIPPEQIFDQIKTVFEKKQFNP